MRFFLPFIAAIVGAAARLAGKSVPAAHLLSII